MSVDPLVSMVLLMSVDSCERTVETVEFTDVLPCKKSSIRLRSCVCSDDASQAINDENGYCELQVKFDKDTNKLEITL
jgi:hypothetical protein